MTEYTSDRPSCTASIENQHSGGRHHCMLEAGHRSDEYGDDHTGPVNDEGVRYCWTDHAIGAILHSPVQAAGGPAERRDGHDAAQAAQGGSGFPDAQGRCPACGGESLMLADGGYITCRRLDCPDPEAAHKAIEERAGAHAYQRAVTTPPSVETCAAIRERLESGNPPRRKVRTTPDNPAAGSDTPNNPLRKRIAHAIHRYDNHHALSGNDIPGKHHFGEADAVLAELKRELDTLADYENRITWHTTCASCARILDSSYAETMRAEKAETALRNIDPAKLDLLADWFDSDDARKGPGRDIDVQADLRRWARGIRAALDGQEQPAGGYDGPSVREAAADDRNWDVEQGGE